MYREINVCKALVEDINLRDGENLTYDSLSISLQELEANHVRKLCFHLGGGG